MRKLVPITLEEEIRKNPQLREEDINALREWAQKQPHLPSVQDRELVLFLHSCYYSLESAKATADSYFTARSHLPEFFTKRDATRSEIRTAVGVTGFVTLPKATPDGHKVIFCRNVNPDPSLFVHCEATKVFLMVTDLWLLSEGTAPGHVIVFDMEGATLGHLARMGIVTFKKFFYYLQEALPFRLKGLHFINVVPFMDKLMAMMKPFMKKEVLDVLHIHADGLDSLEKFVPRYVLPEEYGGDAPSFISMHELTLPRLLANREYFAAEEKRVVQETRRPGKACNAGDLFGVEGSFKKLDID